MLAKSLGDISLQRCKFVIELITKRKSNPRDWVSGAARWWGFCYSLCKEGTQMDEKKLFCNRKIFPKKDPQSWTQLTPFSCFRSFWLNSRCAVVSISVQPADLFWRWWAVRRGQVFLRGHTSKISTRTRALQAASFFLIVYHRSLAQAHAQRGLCFFSLPQAVRLSIGRCW